MEDLIKAILQANASQQQDLSAEPGLAAQNPDTTTKNQ